jgi:hypothetical protein
MIYKRTLIFMVLLTLGAGFAISAIAGQAARDEHPARNDNPARDVNVVNTPDVNVISIPPIETQLSGTIEANVVNTPDVNIISMPPIETQLSGTIDTNVVNIPGVIIENGPDDPLPVTMDSYPRIPYQGLARVSVPAGQAQATAEFSPGLPTSGMLVIEQVSMYANLPTEVEYGNYAVRTNLENSSGFWGFNSPVISPAGFSPNQMRSTETVRLYSDLSIAPPDAYFARFSFVDAEALIRISGYIVPEGSPSLKP